MIGIFPAEGNLSVSPRLSLRAVLLRKGFPENVLGEPAGRGMVHMIISTGPGNEGRTVLFQYSLSNGDVAITASGSFGIGRFGHGAPS